MEDQIGSLETEEATRLLQRLRALNPAAFERLWALALAELLKEASPEQIQAAP